MVLRLRSFLVAAAVAGPEFDRGERDRCRGNCLSLAPGARPARPEVVGGVAEQVAGTGATFGRRVVGVVDPARPQRQASAADAAGEAAPAGSATAAISSSMRRCQARATWDHSVASGARSAGSCAIASRASSSESPTRWAARTNATRRSVERAVTPLATAGAFGADQADASRSNAGPTPPHRCAVRVRRWSGAVGRRSQAEHNA